MSIKAMNWAFDQDLEPPLKVTLLALADWADEGGYCFPGQDSIARKTSISIRSLRRHLVRLEELGLIQRERRSLHTGQRTSDGYRLMPGGQPANLAGSDNRPTVAATKNHQEKNKRARAKVSLPDDWAPNEAHVERASKLGVDVMDLAENFRLHALANGRIQADWDAAFTNWMKQDVQFKAQQAARPQPFQRQSPNIPPAPPRTIDVPEMPQDARLRELKTMWSDPRADREEARAARREWDDLRQDRDRAVAQYLEQKGGRA